MSESVQIKVDASELEKSEKKLSNISKMIANRSLKVQFVEAKGSVVNNIDIVAKELNEISSALSGLVKKTETAITNTRISFANTDNMLAQWFGVSDE